MHFCFWLLWWEEARYGNHKFCNKLQLSPDFSASAFSARPRSYGINRLRSPQGRSLSHGPVVPVLTLQSQLSMCSGPRGNAGTQYLGFVKLKTLAIQLGYKTDIFSVTCLLGTDSISANSRILQICGANVQTVDCSSSLCLWTRFVNTFLDTNKMTRCRLWRLRPCFSCTLRNKNLFRKHILL